MSLTSDNAIEEFIARWGLNAEAAAKLLNLAPEVQNKVVSEFSPRDASRDCNGIFLKFVEGVDQASTESGDIEGFVAQWNLGDEAQQLLFSLRPAMKLKVMREFAPRDTDRDVNGIFLKFVQGVQKGKGQHCGKGKGVGKAKPISMAPTSFIDLAINDFCARWHLGADAQNVLRSQAQHSPDVAEKIMHQFSPRDTSRDANGIFLKFANGIIASSQIGEMPPVHMAQKDDALDFCTRWSLGADAQNLLFSLDADKRKRVMAEFSPRDTSSDVNNIFLKFAQGIMRGVGGKGYDGKAHYGARYAPY